MARSAHISFRASSPTLAARLAAADGTTAYCTDSGELRITFHIPAECEGTGSGSDECQGGWYFELSHEDSGVYHYSQSYPTAEAALAAAEEWERMEWEKERPS
jgi:hypothetical protein